MRFFEKTIGGAKKIAPPMKIVGKWVIQIRFLGEPPNRNLGEAN